MTGATLLIGVQIWAKIVHRGRRVGFAAMPDRDPDCLFCKIVAGEVPGTIVAEDERTVAFMDISPATRGHALVVPRRHTADLGAIDADDLAAVAAAGQRLSVPPRGRGRRPAACDPRPRAARRGRDQPHEQLGLRRLADRLPLPPSRDPAV